MAQRHDNAHATDCRGVMVSLKVKSVAKLWNWIQILLGLDDEIDHLAWNDDHFSDLFSC